jgi:DNA-binding transcriptional MerR regulator
VRARNVDSVLLLIGDFAQRLRVTVRTVRHYEQIGLLAPGAVDPGSGYRTYGTEQLVRGLQIEQLKSAGLGLNDIRAVLDDPSRWDSTLAASRIRTEARILAARAQLVTLESLSAARARIESPEIVEVAAVHVVTMSTTTSAGTLGRAIRRTMQQLSRSTRQQGAACRTFSARMPVDLRDEPITVEVRGHLDAATEESWVQPAERALAATWVGSVELLPIVYDVVLEAARDRGLATIGVVVEHYLDLGLLGSTVVRIPLAT